MVKTKKNKQTPLMRQYYDIKSKYPGTLLLFRVGDFYETFGEDAITASKVLGITLTKRANGSASHVELAGFPYHALDNYLHKLIKAGLRVAVCDQLEDPKKAKGIVKRGVTEIVTPGIAFDEKFLEEKKANYLASVLFTNVGAAAAFLDSSTGEFFALEDRIPNIEKLLYSLKPSEIIVPKSQKETFIQTFGEDFYLYRMDDWLFEYSFAYEKLLKHFQVKNLKPFGLENEKNATIPAGTIIHYLELNEHPRLAHIRKIVKLQDKKYVFLDKNTLKNLEIIEPLFREGKSLAEVIDRTTTPMGGRLLRKWLVFPLKNIKKIQARQEKVKTFLAHPDFHTQILEALQQIADLERLAGKISTKKISPYHLNVLKNSLKEVTKIKELLVARKEFSQMTFANTKPVISLISQYIEEDAGGQLNGRVIRSKVSQELKEIRELQDNAKDALQNILTREKRKTGIPSLKIGFNKVFGYYFEVTNAHKNKVPDYFIRKQTLTQAERYITPELKEFEEKILTAEERISELERFFYDELLQKLQKYMKALLINAQLIAQIDVLSSFALTAREHNYSLPEVTESDVLLIQKGRHPVIEQMLPEDEEYVPNDIYLDTEKQQIIILTGPNMSGKSALLRQTALITLLAHTGSFVPAEAARIGITDKIFTRVGASDNLAAGESTFMVEMIQTAKILHNATKKSLIILDEVGRGTSTYDGVSIAWALTEYIHNKIGAKTLFATHYHELTALEKMLPRIRNFTIDIREIEGKIIFLRKLILGAAQKSFGVHVAEMAGLPKEVIRRANELLEKFEKETPAQNINVTPVQLRLFEVADPTLNKMRELFKNIDINRLTPIEALLKLKEIQEMLEG